jgi:anti-sigma-K factor RskA
MTRSARPDNWQDLIAGYALGNLSPEEAETLQQLLTEHPELTSEVERLQEVLALIPYDVPEHEPPAYLKETILAAAQADDAPLLPLFHDQPRPKPQRRVAKGWLSLAGTLAAAALVALAVENYRLRQEVEIDRPIIAALQQAGAQLYALQGTENAAQASGSIVITPQQQQVLVVAQNLPQLPPGQAYRLWAMPKNSKQPAYCGQFNTNATGTVSTLWPASDALCSKTPAQLLITAESATAPPVPQGDLVMKSRG